MCNNYRLHVRANQLIAPFLDAGHFCDANDGAWAGHRAVS